MVLFIGVGISEIKKKNNKEGTKMSVLDAIKIIFLGVLFFLILIFTISYFGMRYMKKHNK